MKVMQIEELEIELTFFDKMISERSVKSRPNWSYLSNITIFAKFIEILLGNNITFSHTHIR